ncbi:tRNA pseudouridine(38-40) synthase TruA [Enterobacteriaceae endosymbiont of Donacia bicoloricornis]|uniref:tRNA pseudouridine(38-40) synthase TruA n=1 Tax=Enterobacteriaceae endosymbiont of Donacia bicoloricornis TaxID=2675772 RepID=UPI00144A0224|nr:tRNA pseudouridine(38-40) synthase TruA [Enterobacteriaceae endosymbiont of Donacia bicoloricornis]QJC37610.1 tRNA pseudouridine(38-40) synthase TruA [Enterobacteriaceae endosymbiont of Donacia bicoloricornis]
MINLKFKKKYKFALGVEYNGTNYHGWQKQKKYYKKKTVQEHLENAISKIANHNVIIFCAGRTDIGVHSLGQVIHFETYSYRKKESWISGINSLLPKDIVINWIVSVKKEFHARFSALSRRYFYIIYNNKYRSAIFNNISTLSNSKINIKKIKNAIKYLLGEHNFSSFESGKKLNKSSSRNILNCNIKKYGNYILIDIKANAFLYHMVRNIVGSLLEIGIGRKNEDWLLKLIKIKDRTKAAATVKPNGLFLVEVEYPKHFGIPSIKHNLFFFKKK